MVLIANPIIEAKVQELKNILANYSIPPKLTIILANKSEASKRYITNKTKLATRLGIKVNLIKFDEEVTASQLQDTIIKENNNPLTNGILVQLPLPQHINPSDIISVIDPSKDVDSFTEINIGKLFLGEQDSLKPCTIEGIISLLSFYQVKIQGKNIVIAGRSNIVGKPLALRLINLGATVTICNSKTQKIQNFIDTADIFVSAIGQPKFYDKSYFENNPEITVIDVGINQSQENELCGDIDYDEVSPIVKNISPVPGGVGPLTVLHLMINVISAFKNHQKN